MDETLDLHGMEQLCERHFADIVAGLRRRDADADPDLLADAAVQALIDHFKHPEKHDPSRLSLPSYLLMAAARDLQNLRRKEGRHGRRRSDVELGLLLGKEDGGPLAVLERDELNAALQHRLDAVRRAASPEDRAVLDLMRAGERSTRAFAEALGISHLPRQEQEREVKRAKDRLKKRLMRGDIEHDAA